MSKARDFLREQTQRRIAAAAPHERFEVFFRALRGKERADYCKRAKLSQDYVEIHLLPRRKSARLATVYKLAEASQGMLDATDVLHHFPGGARG